MTQPGTRKPQVTPTIQYSSPTAYDAGQWGLVYFETNCGVSLSKNEAIIG